VRRAAGFEFDHGAQYFTVQNDRFAEQVGAWLRGGIVAEWQARFGTLRGGAFEAVRSQKVRYVGRPAMSAMARHLAADLQIQSGVRVLKIEATSLRWRLVVEGGADLGDFDTVLVTVPAPQAVPLLEMAPELAKVASRARLRPCWAVMAAFERQLDVSWDGAFVQESALSWAARNSSKPDRPAGDAWVLHASPDWSDAHLEMPSEEVPPRLLGAFSEALQSPLPRSLFTTAHRWRFALPYPALEDDCLLDVDRGIGAAGDWCGGPRIEGAFLSGEALARRVIGGL
jgi:predicted NAD/FAD-dependent oxidoreductase